MFRTNPYLRTDGLKPIRLITEGRSSPRSVGEALTFWVRKISGSFERWSSLQILTLIIIVGALYRFPGIDRESLWYDELQSILASEPKHTVEQIVIHSRTDQPPVSFLYLRFIFDNFTYTALTGRMACAILGLISIAIVYRLAKEFGDWRTGLVGALITSITYFHIYYSREVGFYTASFLFAALSYLFFVRAMKTIRSWMFVFYFLSTTVLLYTHHYGVFVFASQFVSFIVILFYKHWDRRLVLFGVASSAAVTISYLPWLPTFIADLSYSGEFWIKHPTPLFLAEYFYAYTGKDIVTTLIFVVLVVFAVRYYVQMWRQSHEQASLGWILLSWIVLCYLLPYILSVTNAPILLDRYTIIILPAWVVAFAVGWSQIKGTHWRFVTLVVLILAATVNTVSMRKLYTGNRKSQFREASNYVISKNVEQFPIFSPLAWQFSFYFRNPPVDVWPLTENNLSGVYQFWLLQGHVDDEEMERVIQSMSHEFEVVERQKYFGAEAALLRQRYGPE